MFIHGAFSEDILLSHAKTNSHTPPPSRTPIRRPSDQRINSTVASGDLARFFNPSVRDLVFCAHSPDPDERQPVAVAIPLLTNDTQIAIKTDIKRTRTLECAR